MASNKYCVSLLKSTLNQSWSPLYSERPVDSFPFWSCPVVDMLSVKSSRARKSLYVPFPPPCSSFLWHTETKYVPEDSTENANSELDSISECLPLVLAINSPFDLYNPFILVKSNVPLLEEEPLLLKIYRLPALNWTLNQSLSWLVSILPVAGLPSERLPEVDVLDL